MIIESLLNINEQTKITIKTVFKCHIIIISYLDKNIYI